MLEKIGKGILKYKGVILLVMAILFAVAVVGTVYLTLSKDKINSDMVSYLSEDSTTKRGIVFLQEQFDIQGNATLVVRVNENDENDVEHFHQAVQKVEAMEAVSSVTWYGSVSSYEQLDQGLENVLSVLNENRDSLRKMANVLKESGLYENADDVITLLALADYYDVDFVDTSSMEQTLRQATSVDGVYDYVLIVLTNLDSSDEDYSMNESFAVLESINNEFEYTQYASTGTTETARRLLQDTMGDLPWFILVGVLSVLIILILCSSSFFEPIILLGTLLVGIIVSMGMNYLFPSISIISFALSSVLQLAITMDYAIFFMHTYRKKRMEYEPDVATVKAFPEVAESVLASGFTTIGGFVALYCMQFKIGTDIANVLVKGVALSMITVLLLQPILTLLSDKLIGKTTHRFSEKFLSSINRKREKKGKKNVSVSRNTLFRPVARFAIWQRIVLIVIAVALIVPCYIAQSKVPYSYLELYEKDNETEEDVLANELGNQLILAVPLNTAKKSLTQRDFVSAVRNINPDRIKGILGVFSAVDIKEDILRAMLDVSASGNASDIKQFKKYLTDPSYSSLLEQYGIYEEDVPILTELCDIFIDFSDNVDLDALKTYFRKVNGEWYTLYTISFSGNTEDAEAQKAYGDIMTLCSEYFGQDRFYPVGMITSSYEMASITPHDFLIVTLVSIAIIYLIVTLLLRNPLKSLFIVVIIELGIWINLAINFLLGQSINFIVYVIISSVQLGCTVDYAILFANTFEKNRDLYGNGKECARATAAETIPAIGTSALMIGSVCFGMYLISSNIVIQQLTGMLARGALISLVLVVFVQTAVWSFFKTERKHHNFEERLQALEAVEDTPSATETESNNKSASKKKEKKKMSLEERLALLEKKDDNK